jgi:hypothetical protein
MLSVILLVAAPARSAASKSGACRTVRRGSIRNIVVLITVELSRLGSCGATTAGREVIQGHLPATRSSSGPVVTLGALRSIIGSHRSAAVPPARAWKLGCSASAYCGLAVALSRRRFPGGRIQAALSDSTGCHSTTDRAALIKQHHCPSSGLQYTGCRQARHASADDAHKII